MKKARHPISQPIMVQWGHPDSRNSPRLLPSICHVTWETDITSLVLDLSICKMRALDYMIPKSPLAHRF